MRKRVDNFNNFGKLDIEGYPDIGLGDKQTGGEQMAKKKAKKKVAKKKVAKKKKK